MAQVASPIADRALARSVLFLLYLGYLLSFADRVIFGLVIKPIKATFHFSDSQLGLLAGAAFALSYALFSPAAGWLVDRARRKPVFAGAVGFWSLATFATGMAGSFAGMALARIGVGAGEAALHPLAVSLISDTQPPERRARSFAAYMSAGAVGSLVAMLFGGLLVQSLIRTGGATLPFLGRVEPWRALFVWAAVPGVLLAVLVLAMLREPPRSRPALTEGGGAELSGWGFLKRHPWLCLALFGGVSMVQLGAYTATTWNVVFFERVHGWNAGKAGVTIALTTGVTTLIGCLASGWILSRMRRRGVVDAPFRLCLIAGALFLAFGSAAYLVPDPNLAILLMSIASFGGYVPSVSAFSAMGEALPPPVRARLAGLHTFANGVLSNSLGPFLVGALNDHAFPGAHGVRFSLAATVIGAGAVGLALVALGMSDYRRRLAEVSAA